jgi:hypothetical protein
MTARTFILTTGTILGLAVPTATAATTAKAPSHASRHVQKPLVKTQTPLPPTPWARVIGPTCGGVSCVDSTSGGAQAAVVAQADGQSLQVDSRLLAGLDDSTCP